MSLTAWRGGCDLPTRYATRAPAERPPEDLPQLALGHQPYELCHRQLAVAADGGGHPAAPRHALALGDALEAPDEEERQCHRRADVHDRATRRVARLREKTEEGVASVDVREG
jgi:hypothetical protein